MAKTKDLYANKAYGTVTEGAADTLTFSEIQTNVSIFERVAWIVNRVEWFLTAASLSELVVNEEQVQVALTASNAINTLDLENPSVIDMLTLYTKVAGTAATIIIMDQPWIRDFSALPGGGIIVAPRPLYVAAVGTNLANPVTAECRFYFQQKEMRPEEYLELIDFYRIVQ